MAIAETGSEYFDSTGKMPSKYTIKHQKKLRASLPFEDQRNSYANLNNDMLHLADQGVTINQIHNIYKVPESLQNKWHARSYHGSVEHNSRAVINRYLGYWDANPPPLIPLSPEDSAPLYVEMMPGTGENKPNIDEANPFEIQQGTIDPSID